MSEVVIEARGLTKSFGNGVVAVKDLDLAVSRGAVYGLIGRNGSGKTTVLRLLLGLLQPDRGVAKVLGREFQTAPRSVRTRVAYASQNQHLPGSVTLEELSRCLGRLNERWDPAHARALANRWQLSWRQAIGGFSTGEQRQAAILLAFASRPEVIVLDEPAAGFDLVARRELVNQIIEALSQSDGCTVVLSTHIVADLERTADHIGILDRGRMAISERLEDLLNQTKRVQIIFEGDRVPEGFSVPGALMTRKTGPVVNAIVRWTNAKEVDALHALPSAHVQLFPLGLEEMFLELFGDNGRRADFTGVQPQGKS